MSDKMVDVTLHIDETVSHDARLGVEDELCAMDGVMAVSGHDERPHLLMVEYDPDRVRSGDILAVVTSSGLHAELVGL